MSLSKITLASLAAAAIAQECGPSDEVCMVQTSTKMEVRTESEEVASGPATFEYENGNNFQPDADGTAFGPFSNYPTLRNFFKPRQSNGAGNMNTFAGLHDAGSRSEGETASYSDVNNLLDLLLGYEGSDTSRLREASGLSKTPAQLRLLQESASIEEAIQSLSEEEVESFKTDLLQLAADSELSSAQTEEMLAGLEEILSGSK